LSMFITLQIGVNYSTPTQYGYQWYVLYCSYLSILPSSNKAAV
jgi:hypothetical protein